VARFPKPILRLFLDCAFLFVKFNSRFSSTIPLDDSSQTKTPEETVSVSVLCAAFASLF
jgi:hypothetical protein